MPTEKINDFLTCYFDTMNITDEQIIHLIKNGIIKRFDTYKDHYPLISENTDNYKNYAIKSTNGYYTLEDFLLNRLFQGLREIVKTDDENKTACEYSSKNRTIYLSEAAITKNILSKIDKIPDNIKEKFIEIILSTVFDHELGHALKTQFEGGYKVISDNSKTIVTELFNILKNSLGEEKANEVFTEVNTKGIKSSDNLYKELLERLSTIKDGKYASIILKPSELTDGYSQDIGTGIDKKNDCNETELTLLDELLQETESMNNIGFYEAPQRKTPIGNSGNYINNYHLFSGYSPIIGYGKIITALFGIKNTFQATYLNPTPVFLEFNSLYKDISEIIFQNELSPISNINKSLKKIITTKNENDYLQLDIFFAKCYEVMITKQLSEKTNLDTETVLKEIGSIQSRLTTNDDETENSRLPHNQIFNSLKQTINSYSNTDTKPKTF